jgi:hypothetical protein
MQSLISPAKMHFKNFVIVRNFLLLSFLILVTGCSKYQYVFVDSHMYRNEKKEFITETDTVKLKYTFSGENFPINLTIYNKLQQPLYIDWGRSVVIINNNQMEGSFYRDGQVSFIAPLSYVTVSGNKLLNHFITIPQTAMQNSVILSGSGTTGRKYSFDEKSTPLFFRNVLALTTNEDLSAPTFFDYSFWVSDVIQAAVGPKSMTYNAPYEFYIQKTTGFGTFMGWTGLLATFILLGAVSSGE